MKTICKRYQGKIWQVGVVLIFLFFLWYLDYLQKVKKSKIDSLPRYAIGVFFDASNAETTTYKYRFKVSGIMYEGTCIVSCYTRSVKYGDRFYIRYYSLNPEISELLLDKPVPDLIIENPIDGWEVCPEIDADRMPVNDC